MKHIGPNLIGASNVYKLQRFYILASLALVAVAVPTQQTHAVLVTAGELVVDLRSADLEGDSTTWVNHDTAGDTAGDFSTVGGDALNVAYKLSDSSTTATYSLFVGGSSSNAVLAANLTPSSIIGNETRSAESWVFSLGGSGSQTSVGWGNSGRDQDSSFNYSDGGNGLFNGWFNDGAWDDSVIAGEWVHLAWTYDGDTVRGYRNGQLAGTYDAVDSNESGQKLDTIDTPIGVGAARGGGANAFNGYIADVRVHTGVLSQSDIDNNYLEGISEPEGLACDLDGDGDCDSGDLATLRTNLFSAGGASAGDINRDGYIDWADWRLMKDDPNRVVGIVGGGAPSTTAPEPASIACVLVAAGLLGGAGRVVRRRRKF